MDDDDDDDDDDGDDHDDYDDADEHDAMSRKEKTLHVDASNFKFGGNIKTCFSSKRYGDDQSHESHMTYSQ
eukprot:4460663-Karenia_brevis.AAC.1